MSKKNNKEAKLKIIPLGGLGEIGKNMTVFEYGSDIIVVDVGSIFPTEDLPGVDLVIPDTTYLQQNYEKIRGYFITHGHEDHIGAVPYVMRNVPAPIYGTRLTLALCEHKLKEHRLTGVAPLNVVKAGDVIRAGCFSVEFIHVNHSIPDACALAIRTPVGTIVHTGDFKVDYTPLADTPIDLGRLATIGNEGVLALMCDSTNVERQGYTMSEQKVADTFNQQMARATGRVIIAMFASNVNRIQAVVDSSVRYGRKVCLIGRSMVNVAKIASQLGYLKIPEGKLITTDDLDRYPDDQITVITTGSQGEPMSGLSRMAFAEHRKLEIRESDMVILSANPIPGNEKSVSRVINQLIRIGANVIYEALAEVHVSGHARQEELKLIHSLVKPRYFIPVHGEYRHLHHHANLARALGMRDDDIIMVEIGDVIELGPKSIDVTGVAPSGNVLIDGLGIGDVGAVVLRDRKHLAEDGLLIVVMGLDHDLGTVVSGPDIISRGFVYVRESDALVEGAREAALRAIEAFGPVDSTDWNRLKNDVRESVQRYIFDAIKRNPMILPIIVDI
ncbi:MAG: ribonuclease J [Clostridia bacterium]|nr:ribonuclease J [Clostridia bacterium]